MMRSLWSGVTGLQAHQIAMDVEGNNIANVNTNGFKYGRANFNDLMSQTAKVATAPQGKLGGKNPMQIGLGTQINSVTKIFKQGSIQTTDKQTDLAIQGEGFFVVSADGGNSYKYTRNGDFVRDSLGNFVDNNGYIAQGWLRDDVTGEIDPTTPVKNIVIKPGLTTPANQTNYINLKANLNSGTNIGDKRTPIYELDSNSGWEDINDDGIKNDNNVHYENDEASNRFGLTHDKQLRLKERGVDVGVLFNASGESFGLRTGQGIWVSYAEARTKQLSFREVDNHGVFQARVAQHGVSDTGLEQTRQLSIEINGIKINQTVSSVDDVVTAINAKSSKTGVRAVKENGNKLVLSNDNKTGTTDASKNIHLRQDGTNDSTGLFGWLEAVEKRDDDGKIMRNDKGEILWESKYVDSNNIAEHGSEEQYKYKGIEVITAYQYTYDANAVSTSHRLDSQAARQFHTTEDLRAAMQQDARMWVNYTGVQCSNADWEKMRTKNDGVTVEVNAKGEFVIKNPKGDAFNEDDGDITDITSQAVDNRYANLWDAYVAYEKEEAKYADGQGNADRLKELETEINNAQRAVDAAQKAFETAVDDQRKAENLLKEADSHYASALAQKKADEETLDKKQKSLDERAASILENKNAFNKAGTDFAATPAPLPPNYNGFIESAFKQQNGIDPIPEWEPVEKLINTAKTAIDIFNSERVLDDKGQPIIDKSNLDQIDGISEQNTQNVANDLLAVSNALDTALTDTLSKPVRDLEGDLAQLVTARQGLEQKKQTAEQSERTAQALKQTIDAFVAANAGYNGSPTPVAEADVPQWYKDANPAPTYNNVKESDLWTSANAIQTNLNAGDTQPGSIAFLQKAIQAANAELAQNALDQQDINQKLPPARKLLNEQLQSINALKTQISAMQNEVTKIRQKATGLDAGRTEVADLKIKIAADEAQVANNALIRDARKDGLEMAKDKTREANDTLESRKAIADKARELRDDFTAERTKTREALVQMIHDYKGEALPVRDTSIDEVAADNKLLDDQKGFIKQFWRDNFGGENSATKDFMDIDPDTQDVIFKDWNSYDETRQKDLLAALRKDVAWVSAHHNVDSDNNDCKMFINISNLTNASAGVNENDRFMKTMQGMQGALTSGDGQRQTQGMFLSAHSSSVDIFDSLGSKHSIKFDFTKVGYTDDGGTEWGVVIQVPEPCEINLEGGRERNVLTGRVRFNSDGSLQGFFPSSISFTANNGSTPNQNIELNFGSSNDFDGLTSYDRESNTSSIGQDGYSGGDLTGLRVDESGTIIGSFSNGRSFGLAQVAMATFTNNEGLEADGGNVFIQTSNSGEPIIGAATTGGRGKVQASSLEMSNVDLSRSLTQLIVVQRGYQANSKTITTSDQMLNTLLQLKQ